MITKHIAVNIQTQHTTVYTNVIYVNTYVNMFIQINILQYIQVLHLCVVYMKL